MRSISTHVLDITRGKPAEGVPVKLEKKHVDGGYSTVNGGHTDPDGRMKELVPEGKLTAGTYRITFDTGAYFAGLSVEAFYPEASIVFEIKDEAAHYHVPLLLSPFGYSTYRGS
ncbi:MAG: Transthyretin family protein [Labilithrix sp.]|nr:Transthyretin family protein [Labilithrix sp.]